MRRLWGSKGGRQPLFHHDHIPPLPKLVACAGIEGGPLKPQLRMQPLAVIVWHGNQRVKGGIPLLLQERDQAGIQRPPNPPLLRTRGHVDAQLRVPLERRALVEMGRICIRLRLPVHLADQIGELLLRFPDAPGKLRGVRRIVFKGDRGVPHIGRIDPREDGRILRPGLPDAAHAFAWVRH